MAVIDKRAFTRGDIYWFDYEYTDEAGIKQKINRPAIIVSNNSHNIRANDLEIIWLTTAVKRPMSTHVTINSARKPSTALCERVTSIEKLSAGYFIGHCTDEEMAELGKALVISLDLHDAKNLGQEEPTTITPPATQPSEDVISLKIELAKARAEADLMKELYTKLLEAK